MLRALLSILLLATTLNVMAANPASPPTTPATTLAVTQDQAVQEDIDKLQLEVGILSSKMDAFDGKQANQIALLSNQSSFLGSLIAVVSIVITLIAVWAGFFAHNRAETLANKFEKESEKLLTKAEKEIYEVMKTKDLAVRQFTEYEKKMNRLDQQAKEREEKFNHLREYVDKHLSEMKHVLNSLATSSSNHLLENPETRANQIELDALALNARVHNKPAEHMTAEDYHAQAIEAYARRDYVAAIEHASQGIGSKFSPNRDVLLTARLLFIQAASHSQNKNLGEAIKTYQETISLLKDSTDNEARKILVKSIVNCGVCQSQSGDDKAAIATYRQADELIRDSDSPELRLYKAGALFNTGVSFKNLQQFDEAIHAYQQVIKRYGNDENRDVQQRAVEAAVNLAEAYKILRNYGQAIQVYLEAIKRGDDIHDLHITLGLENTLSSLEYRLSLEGQIGTLGQITEHYENDSQPEIQCDLAYIMYKLGLVHERNEPSKQQAIATLEKLINRFDNIANCKTIVSRARNTLGFIFLMQAKQANSSADKNTLLTKAIPILAAALSSCRDEERAFIAGNLGYAHFLLGEDDKAKQHTREALRQGGKDLLLAQQNDAKQHRLELQDSEYETMLHRLWQDIQHAPDAEQTEPPPVG